LEYKTSIYVVSSAECESDNSFVFVPLYFSSFFCCVLSPYPRHVCCYCTHLFINWT